MYGIQLINKKTGGSCTIANFTSICVKRVCEGVVGGAVVAGDGSTYLFEIKTNDTKKKIFTLNAIIRDTFKYDIVERILVNRVMLPYVDKNGKQAIQNLNEG